MPYQKFTKIIKGKKRWCTRNLNTDKVRCYSTPEKRAIGIKMSHAFKHGWKPTRLSHGTFRVSGWHQAPHLRTSKKGKRFKAGQGKFKRPKYKMYRTIAEIARKKKYKIPPFDLVKGPLVVDEVNIPEVFPNDAFVFADKGKKGKQIYLTFIDDDAPLKNKLLSFAHELGHVHQYEKPKGKHTEGKADTIGADILDIPLQRYKKEIVTTGDVLKRVKTWQLRNKKNP